MSEPLKPGDVAPDFAAAGSDDRTWRLSEVLRESAVLLIFYPGNNTPG
jgi:peroxiredoxin